MYRKNEDEREADDEMRIQLAAHQNILILSKNCAVQLSQLGSPRKGGRNAAEEGDERSVCLDAPGQDSLRTHHFKPGGNHFLEVAWNLLTVTYS